MATDHEVNIDDLFAQGTPIDRAMDQALLAAIERHRKAGVPMVFSRNGEVVEIPAEQVAAEFARAQANGSES
ncbi:MAG: hypothetical protein JSS27_18670 [Planctomycetes bacterium]|nr:hypothetical protein [Planctomycetota bacterium]